MPYQVKISVGQNDTILSIFADEKLLYRTPVSPSAYHITEQTPSIQQQLYKEGKKSTPPAHHNDKLASESKNITNWFKALFKKTDEIIGFMPFYNKEIEYSINTPFSRYVKDKRYKITEGFLEEEPQYMANTYAIKKAEMFPFDDFAQEGATWLIKVKHSSKLKQDLLISGNIRYLRILNFLGKIFKNKGFTVKISPSLISPKNVIELCPAPKYSDEIIYMPFVIGLDILLQSPKEFL